MRYLLTETAARDVEIVAHNLEDAFLTLTGNDPSLAVDGDASNRSAA